MFRQQHSSAAHHQSRDRLTKGFTVTRAFLRAVLLAIPICPVKAVLPQGKLSTISFRSDVQPIFDANCVVCHQGAGAPEGLILEDGKAFSNIVSRPSRQAPLPLITPGSSESSYLLHKLAGTQISAQGRGERMPLGNDLSQADFATIQEWVLAGAKNN
jgi:hypothetical protein